MTMVAGGLAGASAHMISATVTAISRLVFEFKGIILFLDVMYKDLTFCIIRRYHLWPNAQRNIDHNARFSFLNKSGNC